MNRYRLTYRFIEDPDEMQVIYVNGVSHENAQYKGYESLDYQGYDIQYWKLVKIELCLG